MANPQRYLDPASLAKVRNLELEARLLVEGLLSGLHQSPYHGFSVEFAQHREYVPGDDIRHVDWKVYGRTGRFFLKQYEEETNLACWLLLDRSESMNYASGPPANSGQAPTSKYDYAALTAAALAYLILHQQDSVGLVAFDQEITRLLKPSSQPSHFKEIVRQLNVGCGGQKTQLAPIFHDLAERLGRRSIVILLSDLFDAPADLLAGLKHLRYKRHEVVVFHVLDRAELEFPFQQATLFRGLEQLPELLTDPRALRDGYLEQFQAYLKEIERGCRDQDIDYVRFPTDIPVGVTLAHYLAHRILRRS